MTMKDNCLYQMPISELQKLRLKNITEQDVIKYDNGLVEIDLINENKEFIVEFSNDKNEVLKLIYKDNKFGFDRSMCTYTDSTSLPNSYFFDIKEIKS
jgi:beta-fructofuranosidase